MNYLKTEINFSKNTYCIGLQLKILSILFLFFLSIFTYGQKFAVIGDYGMAARINYPDTTTTQFQNSRKVSDLVKSLSPEFIITTGDNVYYSNDEIVEDIFDYSIGQFYSSFIYPYDGEYGSGSQTGQNRFFPCPGNHDYDSGVGGGDWYYDFFTLPDENNERYYDFVRGDVHLFSINTNENNEPDGTDVNSIQAMWLQNKLAASTSKYKIVYLHHPPYSTGHHGCHEYVQWPFAEWGATAVLAGDDHQYEKLEIDGIPYFINGAGGSATQSTCDPNNPDKVCCLPQEASQVKIGELGAMLIEVLNNGIQFEFWEVENNEQPSDVLFIPDPNFSQPDIFITNQTVSNTNPSIDESITLTCTQNVANPSVDYLDPRPYVKFYLSDDTTLDDSDIYLGAEFSTIGTSDLSDDESRNPTVESNWGCGIKYILFIADANEEHEESNESNNSEFVEINIQCDMPDLFITNQAVSTTTPSLEGSIILSCWHNVSGATVDILNPAPDVKYYLSDDTTLDSDDKYLGRDPSSIGTSDLNDAEGIHKIVQSDWGCGTKYILFVADANQEYVESNENNNSEFVEIDIQCDMPDLFISNQAVSTTTPSLNGSIILSCWHNVSGATVDILNPAPDVKYYLSDNTTLDSGDKYLGRDPSSIGTSDLNDAEGIHKIVQTDWGTGTKYILFVADANQEYQENNEDNNVEFVEINVLAEGSDIFITNETVSDLSPCIGESITISCIQNVSNATVSFLDPNPQVRFYVSDDTTLDSSDISLGYEISTIGTSDANDLETRNPTVQDSWGTGTKYILFVADDNNDHTESNENNNIEFVQINVSNCRLSNPDPNVQKLELLGLQVTPNSFKDFTNVSYQLDEASDVSVNIYDVNGKNVADLLVSELQQKGNYTIQFAGQHLHNGIYICTITANEKQESVKLMINR